MRFTRFTVAPLVAALVLGACQGQAVKVLDDPKEILAAAATTAAAATSVHLDLTANGTIALDPLGTGASAPVDLSGSTVSADLDLGWDPVRLFGEGGGQAILSCGPAAAARIEELASDAGVTLRTLGVVGGDRLLGIPVAELRAASERALPEALD